MKLPFVREWDGSLFHEQRVQGLVGGGGGGGGEEEGEEGEEVVEEKEGEEGEVEVEVGMVAVVEEEGGSKGLVKQCRHEGVTTQADAVTAAAEEMTNPEEMTAAVAATNPACGGAVVEVSPADRVLALAELATLWLSHMGSCREIGRAACVCRGLAMRARCDGSVWRAVALRWSRVTPDALPPEALPPDALPAEDGTGGAGGPWCSYSSACASWWARPCGQQLVRDGVVCCGCGRVPCDRCRPGGSKGADTTAAAGAAAAAAAACGTSRTCPICEDVAIGNRSPRWCALCLHQCDTCRTHVCTRHIHRDGRCSGCAEDEWTTFGAFTWERGNANA